MKLFKSSTFSFVTTAAVLFATLPSGAAERLSQMNKDLSISEKVYVAAGLVTLIEFPQGITEVRVGNPQALKILISSVSPKELTIYLTQNAVPPTNLIVRAERRVYVFDIIPSRNTHQDYVKVRSAFGSPQFTIKSRHRVASGAIEPQTTKGKAK